MELSVFPQGLNDTAIKSLSYDEDEVEGGRGARILHLSTRLWAHGGPV